MAKSRSGGAKRAGKQSSGLQKRTKAKQQQKKQAARASQQRRKPAAKVPTSRRSKRSLQPESTPESAPEPSYKPSSSESSSSEDEDSPIPLRAAVVETAAGPVSGNAGTGSSAASGPPAAGGPPPPPAPAATGPGADPSSQQVPQQPTVPQQHTPPVTAEEAKKHPLLQELLLSAKKGAMKGVIEAAVDSCIAHGICNPSVASIKRSIGVGGAPPAAVLAELPADKQAVLQAVWAALGPVAWANGCSASKLQSLSQVFKRAHSRALSDRCDWAIMATYIECEGIVAPFAWLPKGASEAASGQWRQFVEQMQDWRGAEG
ncbi:hypothetical protein ABPG75_006494 [Micractinium tetrahymenae]